MEKLFEIFMAIFVVFKSKHLWFSIKFLSYNKANIFQNVLGLVRNYFHHISRQIGEKRVLAMDTRINISINAKKVKV